MSLILDALRKSDRQRSRNVAERLRDGPGIASPPLLSGRQVLAGGGVLLLLVVLVLVLLLRGTGSTAPSSAPATGDAVEIMENGPPVRSAEVRSLAMELARSKPDTPDGLAEPAPKPGNVPATVTLEELSAPPLGSMPEEFRAALPSLHVDIHAWAEDPGARFVLINLRRYREGDRLADGPLVRQILPHGVVLEYRGQLFSLPRQ